MIITYFALLSRTHAFLFKFQAFSLFRAHILQLLMQLYFIEFMVIHQYYIYIYFFNLMGDISGLKMLNEFIGGTQEGQFLVI